MTFSDIVEKSKSQALELCSKEILNIKKANTIELCHWHEGRAHGIILIMYNMGLINYLSYQRENLSIITTASERRGKIIKESKNEI